MKHFSIFRIFIFICLLFFTSIPRIVIATAPGTFTEWSTKCFSHLKEYASPSTNYQKPGGYSHDDFVKIGQPELTPLINQYNTNHPKKSTPEKPGFVQKLVLIKDSELCVIGDIHSSLHSLLRILWRLILTGYLDINLKIIKPDFYMVFTGDYTDRGRYGIEVLITLLMLANQNFDSHTKKNKIFLLRGNHEETQINKDYGFNSELCSKYGDSLANRESATLNLINEWYSHLSLALFVGRNNAFAQCCHGGIEPTFDVKDFLQTDATMRDLDPNKWQGFSWCDAIFEEPILYFTENRGYIKNRPELNQELKIIKFFEKNPSLKCFFRGHQHYEFGLKMFKDGAWNLTHWLDVVTPETKTIKLAYYNKPVYTFSTGAEGVIVPYDCYGIVKIGATWNDWTLTPYEFPLDPLAGTTTYAPESAIRNDKFALLKKNVNYPATSFDPLDLTPGGWQTDEPVQPISPEIIATLKLLGLKTSLENLKAKLGTLKTKLTELKRH